MKVRAWDDMEKEFGLDAGGDIKCRCWFTKQMRDLCGKIVQIESVSPESKTYCIKDDYHTFTDDMLEADDFKVGDRVRIVKQYVRADEIEKITTCDEKIVITTDGKATLARLYENGKVTKTAKAECSPSDKFDFAVGAKLAFERLNEKTEPKKLFNGKAVCVEKNSDYCAYTVGKIYEFKDGATTLDNGTDYPANGNEVTSIDDWNSRYPRIALAKFLEIKE